MLLPHKIMENVGCPHMGYPYKSNYCLIIAFLLGNSGTQISIQCHHDESNSDVVGQHEAEAHKVCEGMQGREQHQNAAKPRTTGR